MSKQLDAEGVAVRKKLFGVDDKAEDEMGDSIVLGDNTHPTPIIINGQQSSGTLGKVLAGAAIAAGLMGIPAAGIIGYGVSQLLDRKPVPTEDTSLDVGLGHIEDLLPFGESE